jgi:hypothetical protein
VVYLMPTEECSSLYSWLGSMCFDHEPLITERVSALESADSKMKIVIKIVTR